MNPYPQNIALSGRYSISQAAALIGVSRKTMYRYTAKFTWLLPVHEHIVGHKFLYGRDLIKFQATEKRDRV